MAQYHHGRRSAREWMVCGQTVHPQLRLFKLGNEPANRVQELGKAAELRNFVPVPADVDYPADTFMAVVARAGRHRADLGSFGHSGCFALCMLKCGSQIV